MTATGRAAAEWRHVFCLLIMCCFISFNHPFKHRNDNIIILVKQSTRKIGILPVQRINKQTYF